MKRLLIIIFSIVSALGCLPANYYVNSNSSAGGVLTTGGGKDASGYGALINKPSLTLSYIFTTYGASLSNGDSIIVDKGVYNTSSDHNFTISKAIVIKGAGNGNGGGNCTDFKDNLNDHYFAKITAGATLLNMKIENYGSDGSLINGQAIDIVLSSTATVTINNVLFYGNSYGSGAFYSVVCIENSNAAVTATVNMNSTSFQCNGAVGGSEGGGIDVIGSRAVNLNCNNVLFLYSYKSEYSLLEGSALAVTNSNATVTLSNCRISHCEFDYTGDTHGGGSIYQTAGSLTITNSIIENSILTAPASGHIYGGAIYSSGGTLSVTGTLIQNTSNTSSIYGTVGIVGGSVTISNSKFLSNASAAGNDVYISSGSLSMSNTVISTTSSPNSYELYKGAAGTYSVSTCGGSTSSPNNYYNMSPTNTTSSSGFSAPSVTNYSGTCGTIVLPIELVSFGGECENGSVTLRWTTASESNNWFFVVERSSDFVEWKGIDAVNGAGNSNSSIDYNITCVETSELTCYYRLKQVDFDGAYKYSGAVAVAPCSYDKFRIAVLSNPVTRSFDVNVTCRAAETVGVVVKNAVGEVIYNAKCSMCAGSSAIHVNLGNCSAGLYFLAVAPYDNSPIITRILVKN